MYEPRLIGTWQSDAKKTAREIDARNDIPLSKKSKLKKLMGKLELRYTRNRCYAKLGDEITPMRYSVVARDETSVAIVTAGPILGRKIVHIQFEDKYYWVCLGNIREYFKQLKRSPK
jgi:hypothetical protein